MRAVRWLVTSLVLVACAQSATTPVRPATKAALRSVPAAPSSQYRLLPLTAVTRQQVDFGDDTLRLYGGLRIEERAGQSTFADTFALPAIAHGRRLPDFAGGGFLFWSNVAMFRAETFLGRLQPLQGTPSPVERVELGPGCLVAIELGNTRRFFDAKTGAKVAPQPIGITDVAAAGDGRVVSALQFERYAVSLDNNRTTREVQEAELGGPVQRLSEDPLGFVLDGGAVAELKADGRLVKNGIQAVPDRDPSWPGQDSPLERAVTAGVLRTADRAVVAIGSAVGEVDLRSGKLLSLGPQLLPGEPVCELFEQGSELLMQCRRGNQVTILSQLAARPATIEKIFSMPTVLTLSKAQAFADVSCESQRKPLTACVRQPDGKWQTVSAPATAAPLTSVISYGFKVDAGIVAFVDDNLDERARVNPAVQGYVDLATGKLTPLRATQPLRNQIARAACRVERDGGVRCLSPNGPISFAIGTGSDTR